MFTFDSMQRIDAPDIANFPLILVNGKDLSPYASIKESSLLNGNFHPKVKNYENAYNEVSPIINKAHAQSNVLFVSSVYSEVADNLREIRSMAKKKIPIASTIRCALDDRSEERRQIGRASCRERV